MIPSTSDFEKLGVFYLGRRFDLANGKPLDDLVLYDCKDLVTHAVCVGMTGSGKTGLCINLLEEAAIDSIPAIVIDPKGDLSNLLLTFPDLKPDDFLPWVNESDAQKRGQTPAEFAKGQAELWKKGLAEWGEDGARIQRLRDAADFTVYTPGSNAGLPVSILKSFAVPEKAILDEAELLRERISTAATSLLGLLGIEADPVKSREHILVSTIFGNLWKQGKDLDLAMLIQLIHNPPVTRVGVMELESFFPAKDRFELAMMLNNLLASPGFEIWLEGEPLDIDHFLHTDKGKPRVAIFSISHLGDAERMFFVSLLLNQILGWMRMQPGTTSLRALVYMDEIFGYFPPVKNPPSKTPLLTLLKQARAFGVGMVLATQNPVDLDYKGLSNAGTWFIGRLQTERDKLRVLEGLEGAAATTGSKFNRQELEQTLAGLGNRVFLMHNVHEDHPVVFQSRWALSYLRGPLTRNQIRSLMEGQRAPTGPPPLAKVAPADGTADAAPAAIPVEDRKKAPAGSRPILPPEVPQFFVPMRQAKKPIVYRPNVLGCGKVYYADAKSGVDMEVTFNLLTNITDAAVAVSWDGAEETDLTDDELDKAPAEEAAFAPLPGEAIKLKSFDGWKKTFVDWIYRNHKLEIFKCRSLGQWSRPHESERDFRVRLQQAAREARDFELEKLRQKFAPKLAALDEKIRNAQQVVQREYDQASQSKIGTVLSFSSSVLSAIFSRKTVSVTNISKATTAARSAGRAYKDGKDVTRAQEDLDSLVVQKQKLDADFQAETKKLEAKIDPLTEELTSVALKPKKTNISVRLVALAWQAE